MAVAVGYLAERAAAVRSWRRQARTGTPPSARAPLGSAREWARRRAVWSSPRCNARQDASVDCREGGGWPWRSHHVRSAPSARESGGGSSKPWRRCPTRRGFGRAQELDSTVAASILKQRTARIDRPTRVRFFNNYMQRKLGGTLPHRSRTLK
jgi:hypothetical protein